MVAALPTAPSRPRGEPTETAGATTLARGVMAAQATLTRFVQVRPLTGQPTVRERVGFTHREAAVAALLPL